VGGGVRDIVKSCALLMIAEKNLAC
jgi:hypothetical protein